MNTSIPSGLRPAIFSGVATARSPSSPNVSTTIFYGGTDPAVLAANVKNKRVSVPLQRGRVELLSDKLRVRTLTKK